MPHGGWQLHAVVLAGIGIGATGGFVAMRDVSAVQSREDIQLPRSELRSNLAEQPLPAKRREIIEAMRGHSPGHVISSTPRQLAEGAYKLEMEVELEDARDASSPSCIMDLLAGNHLLANVPVTSNDPRPQLLFKSPANGTKEFTARLFCDGRETVRVLRVTYFRNPDSPPKFIYQN